MFGPTGVLALLLITAAPSDDGGYATATDQSSPIAATDFRQAQPADTPTRSLLSKLLDDDYDYYPENAPVAPGDNSRLAQTVRPNRNPFIEEEPAELPKPEQVEAGQPVRDPAYIRGLPPSAPAPRKNTDGNQFNVDAMLREATPGARPSPPIPGMPNDFCTSDACGTCDTGSGGLFSYLGGRGCGLKGCGLYGGLMNRITCNAWIDQGFTVNTFSPHNRSNFPVTFNDYSNDYQFNQLYVPLEMAVDEDGCSWDIGGRVDMLYGTDSRYTMSRGLETYGDWSPKWNHDDMGLSMPQAYMEVYAPIAGGMNVKVGHFYTILGYEVVPAKENFFYSHAYAMQYGEPFTHTGALGSIKVGGITWQGGVTRGWDNWQDNNNLSFLGGFNSTSCDGRTTFAFAIDTGREADEPPQSDHDRTTFSLVLTHQLNDRAQYVIQYDHGFERQAINGRRDAKWYGVNQYLFYTINPCWKAGMRFEWFRDEDGFRVVNGLAADYFELTVGLNWQPRERLIVRPEFRWDWVDTPGAHPFVDNTRHQQILVGCDVIWSF